MTWFTPYAPAPDLGEVLACRYVAASAGHHDLLPDGCMDLVWTAEVGVMLCGPDTRGWSFEMPPGREMAGVRFRAGAAAGVFRVDAASLVDRRVGLADVVGSRTARRFADALSAAPDDAARMDAFEALVRRRVRDVDDAVGLAGVLTADPRAGVDALAGHAGLSPRQLRRRFDRAVGYGPAFFARIARLQRFATAAVRRPELGLAELAVTAGYGDQSHLAKDARALAGRTPRELLGTLGRSSLAVDLAPDGRSVQDATARAGARWAA